MRAGLTGLTNTFNRFVESERSSGLLLLGCTALAIVIANGQWGPAFHHLLEWQAAGLSIEQWINDGLMSVFFLLIGLELERELYSGELSDPRRALLPAVAAGGRDASAGAAAPRRHGRHAARRGRRDPGRHRHRLRARRAHAARHPRAARAEGVRRGLRRDG
jgi:hypothetical protein